MKKFLVLYCAPAAGMAEWMQMPQEARQAEEDKMKAEWDAWTKSHPGLQSVVAGAGKTKRVTQAGVADVANDVMLYAIAEGESAEAVAAAFVGHPHFGIPTGWIDIMPINYLPGMEACWIVGLLVVGLVLVYAFALRSPMNTDDTNTDAVQVTPIAHASLALHFGDTLVIADPTGDASQYAALGEPNFILLTHAHGDHLSTSTLEVLNGTYTVIVAPQSVADVLPDSLKINLRIMKNGDKIDEGGLIIDAVPAYNLREADKERHPTGRDNGYVVQGMGTRVYIAGDTEDIPEMRALAGIDIAFVPMNPPYTMTVEAAADAVVAFKPRTVYPYHYRTPTGLSDVAKFKSLVNAGDSSINVVLGDWYAD